LTKAALRFLQFDFTASESRAAELRNHCRRRAERCSASKRKKLDYPEETEGSRLAAKVRKLASKLTLEE